MLIERVFIGLSESGTWFQVLSWIISTFCWDKQVKMLVDPLVFKNENELRKVGKMKKKKKWRPTAMFVLVSHTTSNWIDSSSSFRFCSTPFCLILTFFGFSSPLSLHPLCVFFSVKCGQKWNVILIYYWQVSFSLFSLTFLKQTNMENFISCLHLVLWLNQLLSSPSPLSISIKFSRA